MIKKKKKGKKAGFCRLLGTLLVVSLKKKKIEKTYNVVCSPLVLFSGIEKVQALMFLHGPLEDIL